MTKTDSNYYRIEMVNASVTLGLALTLCCCCGITIADLAKDLQEFNSLFPRLRIDYIAAKYYIFDEEFQSAVHFVRSNEFFNILHQMRKSPKASELINYLKKSTEGNDLTPVIKDLYELLHNYKISQMVPVDMMRNHELTSFLHEVTQVLPKRQINNFVARKIRVSKPFQKFYDALMDKEFKNLVTEARVSLVEATGWHSNCQFK